MKKSIFVFLFLTVSLIFLQACHKKVPQPEGPSGELKVLAGSPKGDNLPISVEGISIMFNQAMVPLTTLDQGRSQSIPLEILPKINGKFYWLGTHGFIFRPEKPFDPATRYSVKIPGSVSSINGKKLGQDMTWNFSTVVPRVTNSTKSEEMLMPHGAEVEVEFNLAMNTAQTESKIQFLVNDQPNKLSAQYKWEDNDHTLIISFKEPLPWNSQITVKIPSGLNAKMGELTSLEEAEFKYDTPSQEMVLDKLTLGSCYEDTDENVIEGKNEEIAAGEGICFCFNQPLVKSSFEKSFRVAWNDKWTTPEIRPFFTYGNREYYPMPDDMEDGDKPYDSVCAYFLDEFARAYSFTLNPKTIRAYSQAQTNLKGSKYLVKTGHAEPEIRSTLTKSILSSENEIALPYRTINLKSLTIRAYKINDNKNYSEEVKDEKLNIKGHYDNAIGELVYDTPYVSYPLVSTHLSLPVSEASKTIDQTRMAADSEIKIPLDGKIDQSNRVMASLNPMHLKTGLYLIEAFGTPEDLPGELSPIESVLSMIQITPYGLALKQEADHALVWVTNLESGKPKSGVDVTLTLKSASKIVRQEKLVTNSDGIALSSGNWESSNKNDGQLNLCAEISSPDSYSCMNSHKFEYQNTLQHRKNYFTSIQTDRPIYRPGQTVYFSSFIREVKEGRHFMPGKGSLVDVQATDSDGGVVFEKKGMALEAGGVIQESFSLDDDEGAPRGNYSLNFTLENGQSFQKSFSVSSYKKPSFKVDLTSSKKEIVNKTPLATEIKGTYFFGAPMSHSKARITLLTNTYIFSPEGFEDYAFDDPDELNPQGTMDYSYIDFDGGDYEGYDWGLTESADQFEGSSDSHADKPQKSFFDKKTKMISKILDENGKTTLDTIPDLTNYPLSQELTLEAAVSDPSHEEVSGFADMIVHKANYYLGLKPQKWVMGEKDKARIDVVSLNTDGTRVASKSFKIDFVKREYKFVERRDARGYWELYFEPKDEVLSSQDIKTNSKEATTIEFEIPQAGTYRIVASGSDGKNTLQKSAIEIYAWGKDYVPWKLGDAQTLELVPDKKSYKIGETAHVLVKSLVPPTKALLTLERGRLLDTQIIELDSSNANHIDIPITEGLIPNIYLNVVAHVGRDGARPPMLFKGECELVVEPEKKRVQIAVALDKKPAKDGMPIYKPGDTVTATIKTTDPDGKPLKTHLIVTVADESVLRLMGYELPDLVKKFFYNRANSVKTSSSLVSFKAGDGSGSADNRKRRNFKDTATFEGHLITNDEGLATFTFKLPDDLTTWVLDAYAISESKDFDSFEKERMAAESSPAQKSLQSDLKLTDNTFVGSVRNKLMTTLPVTLRPALPRFAAWGDSFFARVIANNQNPETVSGSLHIQVSGDAALDHQTDQIPFKIPGNSEKVFDVQLKIQKPQTGHFTFSVEAHDDKNTLIDSFEKSVPVKDRYAAEMVATSGKTQGEEKEQILLPPGIEKEKSTLKVEGRASLAVALAGSLKQLISYPYDCSEQKSSSLIALLLAHDFVNALGEDYFNKVAPLSEQELKGLTSFSQKKDYLITKANDLISDIQSNYLAYDGGVKYWPESQGPSLFPSIQVLFAFEKAMDQGLQVDSSLFNQILGFVNKNLELADTSSDLKAYGLWVTSLAFQYNPALTKKLLAQKSELSTAGLSYLLMAIHLQKANEQDAAQVRDQLIALAKQEPRHTSWPASSFFAGSIIKNTALASMALLKTDPQNPLIERGFAFLLNRKRSATLPLTQDPLAVSLAVHELSRQNNELNTDFTSSISLGDQNLLKSHFDKSSLLQSQENTISLKNMPDTPVDLVIKKEGPGTLYTDLLLTYYLPPTQTPPREEGLMISRDYFEMDDIKEEKPLTQFVAGKNYKAHMTLLVPQALYYILVKDVLPAGFEPIDMSLKTSSLAAAIAASESNERANFAYSRYADEIIIPDFGTDYGFVHQEIHDDAILWSDTYVPPGTYHLRYPVRAVTAGTFLLPGAEAFEFYEPEIFGRSKPGFIEISRSE